MGSIKFGNSACVPSDTYDITISFMYLLLNKVSKKNISDEVERQRSPKSYAPNLTHTPHLIC